MLERLKVEQRGEDFYLVYEVQNLPGKIDIIHIDENTAKELNRLKLFEVVEYYQELFLPPIKKEKIPIKVLFRKIGQGIIDKIQQENGIVFKVQEDENLGKGVIGRLYILKPISNIEIKL